MIAATAFYDTSVLVAALDGSHPHHAPSIGLIGIATPRHAFCAAHSYAEVYAVMSGKPGKPRLRPSDVDAMIERLDHVVTPIVLTRREYRDVIRQQSAQGIAGGRIYDALILACAVKSDATAIYTWNEKDFVAIAAPEVVGKIRRP